MKENQTQETNQHKKQSNTTKLPSPKTSVLIRARLRAHTTRLWVLEHIGKIVSTLIKLKNKSLTEGTLRNTSFQLKYLTKNVDIDNPSEVEAFIANKRCANSCKANLVKAYNYYAIANVYEGLDPHTNVSHCKNTYLAKNPPS